MHNILRLFLIFSISSVLFACSNNVGAGDVKPIIQSLDELQQKLEDIKNNPYMIKIETYKKVLEENKEKLKDATNPDDKKLLESTLVDIRNEINVMQSDAEYKRLKAKIDMLESEVSAVLGKN